MINFIKGKKRHNKLFNLFSFVFFLTHFILWIDLNFSKFIKKIIS
ncbi:hypothetical protein NEOC95_001325 [Neochlamydia sp. AcF95]|nr:hypothetical protein [Neochlamydia sp. AcF95]